MERKWKAPCELMCRLSTVDRRDRKDFIFLDETHHFWSESETGVHDRLQRHRPLLCSLHRQIRQSMSADNKLSTWNDTRSQKRAGTTSKTVTSGQFYTWASGRTATYCRFTGRTVTFLMSMVGRRTLGCKSKQAVRLIGWCWQEGTLVNGKKWSLCIRTPLPASVFQVGNICQKSRPHWASQQNTKGKLLKIITSSPSLDRWLCLFR